MKNFLFGFLVFAFGCNSTRPVAHSGTATYKVTSVQKIKGGSVVSIEGVKGEYLVHSDTLKVNDLIEVSWVRPN